MVQLIGVSFICSLLVTATYGGHLSDLRSSLHKEVAVKSANWALFEKTATGGSRQSTVVAEAGEQRQQQQQHPNAEKLTEENDPLASQQQPEDSEKENDYSIQAVYRHLKAHLSMEESYSYDFKPSHLIKPLDVSLITSGYLLRKEYSNFTCGGVPSLIYIPFGVCFHSGGAGMIVTHYNQSGSSIGVRGFSSTTCSKEDLLYQGSVPVSNSTCFEAPVSPTSDSTADVNSFTVSYVASVPSSYALPNGVIYKNYSSSYDCYYQQQMAIVTFRPGNVCLWRNTYDIYLGEWSARAYKLRSCSRYSYSYYGYSSVSEKTFGRDLTCQSRNPSNYESYNYWYDCRYEYETDGESENYYGYRGELASRRSLRTINEHYTSTSCAGPNGYFYATYEEQTTPTPAPTILELPPFDASLPGFYVESQYNNNPSRYSSIPCLGEPTSATIYQLNLCKSWESWSEIILAFPLDAEGKKFTLKYYYWYDNINCDGIPSYSYEQSYSSSVCVGQTMYYHSQTFPSLGHGLEENTYRYADCGKKELPFQSNWYPAMKCRRKGNSDYGDVSVPFCFENAKGRTIFSGAYFNNSDHCSGSSYSFNYTVPRCSPTFNLPGHYTGTACHGGNYNLLSNWNPPPPEVSYKNSETRFVGSYYPGNGDYYYSNPPTVSCVEACAKMYGGYPSDYIGSTRRDKATGTCFGKVRSAYASSYLTIPDDYKFCTTYYQQGCISALVYDYVWVPSNYCFLNKVRDLTKYKPSFLCSPFKASFSNDATDRYSVCSIYACGGDKITINGGCFNRTGSDGSFCYEDQFFRLFDGHGNEVSSNDDFCRMCSAIHYRARGSCQSYELRQGCYGSVSCHGITAVAVEMFVPNQENQDPDPVSEEMGSMGGILGAAVSLLQT